MGCVAQCIGAAALLGGNVATASDLDVAGLWQTPDGSSVVQIMDCGDGTPCGVVVSVDPECGGMLADENNPEPDLRGRDMVGVTLLHGFSPRRGAWGSGAIYNPKDGRTYRAHLQLLSDEALSVSGCLGPICKKLIWERADADEVATSGEVTEVAAL